MIPENIKHKIEQEADWRSTNGHGGVDTVTQENFILAAEYGYGLAQEGRWIDVKNKLPETDMIGVVKVFCLVKNSIPYIMDFINDCGQQKFYTSERFLDFTEYVTHWQYLPDLPKK